MAETTKTLVNRCAGLSGMLKGRIRAGTKPTVSQMKEMANVLELAACEIVRLRDRETDEETTDG